MTGWEDERRLRFFYNVLMPETKTLRLTETVKAAG
jgi:hypothetical protein